ncbi:MAG: hypothetical protein HYW77_01595 [Parcubacteria group bacterium]|nr:hypothetical protein [Parcubacteria group bacterium]
MLTPTHAVPALFFLLKQKWRKRYFWVYFSGSILPDIPLLIDGAFRLSKVARLYPKELFQYASSKFFSWDLWDLNPWTINEHFAHNYQSIPVQILREQTEYLNRLPPVILVLIVLIVLKKTLKLDWLRYPIHFCTAWAVFGILPDIFTHEVSSHVYLWPIYNESISGFISHGNKKFLSIDTYITLISLFFYTSYFGFLIYQKIKQISVRVYTYCKIMLRPIY